MKSINSISGTSLSGFQMRSIKGGEDDRPKVCMNCDITGGSTYGCAKDAMGNCACKGDNSDGVAATGACSLVKPPRN